MAPCRPCAERRKKFQALRDAKKLKRQGVQAAAIGAVLGAFEVGGKMLGINGEEEKDATDQQEDRNSDSEPS